MSLKLLNILKEEIAEQGYGHYFKDWELSGGKKVGDTRGFDFTTNKPFEKDYKNPESEVLSSEEVDMYDENVTYQEDKLLGYHERAKKDKEDGITNPNLISDIIKALRIANISAEIHYSRTGHKKHAKNGNISRHWAGNGVDISVIDGVGNKGGDGSNKGLCCPTSPKFMSGGDKIVVALQTLGYKYGERGNVKGYLWRTDTGGNHWNHIHVSNTDRAVKSKIIKQPQDQKTSTYDSLPSEVKKAVDKLKSNWGVTITDYHLNKEIAQESGPTEDAGDVNKEAQKEIKNLIKDCKKKYPNVAYPDEIVSGYRSYDDQVINFGSKVKGGRTIEDVQSYNTIPGFSQHHTGKAFDIFSTEPSWWDTNSDVKKWVADNCVNYGFEITYKVDGTLRKKEPWHLFYVGGVSETEDDEVDDDGEEEEVITSTGGKTVVFGGMSYATPEWMKSQWVAAGLPVDRAVFLAYTSTELANVKKNNTIDKIVGFSAGGTDVWDEIMTNSSDYVFMGLIDPSTSQSVFEKYKDGGLPSQVKSLSNSANWSGENAKIGVRLKKLEDNGVLTKTSSSHKSIPLEFFKKYKTNLS